jgi:hypothetical protein
MVPPRVVRQPSIVGYPIAQKAFSRNAISTAADQHIGGIVIWIPPSMMSAMGFLLVLNALRRHEHEDALWSAPLGDAGCDGGSF